MAAGRKLSEVKSEAGLSCEIKKIMPPYVEDADLFHSLIFSHLYRLSVLGEPFNMVLLSWNHPFGIGDFMHNRNFSRFYRTILQDAKDIHLQSFCFISSSKIKQVKLLLDYELDSKHVYFFNADAEIFDLERAKYSQYVIWLSKEMDKEDMEKMELDNIIKPSENPHRIKNKSILLEYLRIQKNMINVSREDLWEPTLRFMLENIDVKKGYLQSICELGVYAMCTIRSKTEKVVFDAVSMGVNSEVKEIGMQFSKNLMDIAQRIRQGNADLQKAKFLDEKKFSLFSQFIGEDKPEIFFSKNRIGFCFMQSQKACERLVLSVIGSSEKPCATIFFINLTKIFVKSLKSTSSLPLLKLFEREGFGSIKITDESTEIIQISDDPRKTKQLCLVNLSGISDKYKEMLIGISDVVGGSGDSSYSDVFSAGQLPFFEVRPWKMGFFAGMLADIQKNCPTLTQLEEYIKIIIRTIDIKTYIDNEYVNRGPEAPGVLQEGEITHIQFLEFIKRNHQELVSQFREYRDYCCQHHNVIHEQHNILMRSLVASILSSGSDKEINQLLLSIPSWRMDPNNFLFFAAERNNQTVLMKLYRQNKKLFAELVNKKHPLASQSYAAADKKYTMEILQRTPLDFMIINNDFKMIKLMLKDPILFQQSLTVFMNLLANNPGKLEECVAIMPEIVSFRNQSNQTLLHLLALKQKGEYSFTLPEQIKESSWNYPDCDGNTPLMIAVKHRNKKMMKILLPHEKNSLQRKSAMHALQEKLFLEPSSYGRLEQFISWLDIAFQLKKKGSAYPTDEVMNYLTKVKNALLSVMQEGSINKTDLTILKDSRTLSLASELAEQAGGGGGHAALEDDYLNPRAAELLFEYTIKNGPLVNDIREVVQKADWIAHSSTVPYAIPDSYISRVSLFDQHKIDKVIIDVVQVVKKYFNQLEVNLTLFVKDEKKLIDERKLAETILTVLRTNKTTIEGEYKSIRFEDLHVALELVMTCIEENRPIRLSGERFSQLSQCLDNAIKTAFSHSPQDRHFLARVKEKLIIEKKDSPHL